MSVLNPCLSEETENRSPKEVVNAKHPLGILIKVGTVFGISTDVIVSHDRHRSIARARFGAMWVFRELGIYSYPEIGRILFRDHTTILHGFRKAETLRETDVEFKRLTDHIIEELKK